LRSRGILQEKRGLMHMIPVDQTIVNLETGDCVRACVASIFELSIDDVPNFMCDGPDGFHDHLTKWCDKFGILALDVVRLHEIKKWMKGTYMIALGPSPRRPKGGDQLHAVVWYNGKMVHDPIPPLSPAHVKQKAIGFEGDPEMYTIFIVRDPSKLTEVLAYQQGREK